MQTSPRRVELVRAAWLPPFCPPVTFAGVSAAVPVCATRLCRVEKVLEREHNRRWLVMAATARDVAFVCTYGLKLGSDGCSLTTVAPVAAKHAPFESHDAAANAAKESNGCVCLVQQ